MTRSIYKITHLSSGKFYVGSTIDTRGRFQQHRKLLRKGKHHCKPLQAAWNKYGEQDFHFHVVEEVPENRVLQEIEEIYLVQHVGKPYCYNTGRSADAPWRGAPKEITPNFGKVMSLAAKEQISKTLKEFYAEDPTNHPRFGKEHTEETKKKISESRVGKMSGENHYRFGQTLSDEVKQKIGDTQRGVPKGPGRQVSEEGQVKIAAAAAAGHYSHWQGRTHTEEAKQKMRKPILEVTTEKTFDSLTSTLQFYDMTMPTLIRALKSGKPITKGKYAGLVFKYG